MSDEKYNPWAVTSIDMFNFLCCPECVYRSKDESSFQTHAVQNHPDSRVFFIPKEVNDSTAKNNIYYCCPECDFKSKDVSMFQIHVLKEHPKVHQELSMLTQLEIESRVCFEICDYNPIKEEIDEESKIPLKNDGDGEDIEWKLDPFQYEIKQETNTELDTFKDSEGSAFMNDYSIDEHEEMIKNDIISNVKNIKKKAKKRKKDVEFNCSICSK